MFIFTLTAIILASLIIAYKFDITLSETLGPSCIMAIIVMYVAAFFRGLYVVDLISIALIVIMTFWIVRNRLMPQILKRLATVTNLSVLVTIVLIVFFLLKKDVHFERVDAFYAADIKALYTLGGFAACLGNVFPRFGDYPPAMQLWGWLIAHASSESYHPGLYLTGYTCLNFILLLPLLNRACFRKISIKSSIWDTLTGQGVYRSDEDESDAFDNGLDDDKNDGVSVRISKNKKYRFVYESYRLKSKYKVHIKDNGDDKDEKTDVAEKIIAFMATLVTCLALVLVPAMICAFSFDSLRPDITMGIAVGMLLLCIFDIETSPGLFYGRIALYGSFIILCRTWGILWLIIVMIPMTIRIIKKRDALEELKYLICVPVIWLSLVVSWVVMCIYKTRISELSKYTFHMLMGRAGQALDVKAKFIEMVKAISVFPLMQSRVGLVRLSPVILLIIFMLFIYIAERKCLIEDNIKNIYIYIGAVFIICHGVMFLIYTHLWESIEYSVTEVSLMCDIPLCLMLIIYSFGILTHTLNENDSEIAVRESKVDRQLRSRDAGRVWKVYLGIAFIAFISCEYPIGILGSDNTSAMEQTYDSDNAYDRFIETLSSHVELNGRRVLYLTNGKSDICSWDDISLEASPVSVVYSRISTDFNEDSIRNIVSSSNAAYVYVDDMGEDMKPLFSEMCIQDWEYEHIYQIGQDGMLDYIEIE